MSVWMPVPIGFGGVGTLPGHALDVGNLQTPPEDVTVDETSLRGERTLHGHFFLALICAQFHALGSLR